MEELRSCLLEAVNAERARRRLPLLELDSSYAVVCQSLSDSVVNSTGHSLNHPRPCLDAYHAAGLLHTVSSAMLDVSFPSPATVGVAPEEYVSQLERRVVDAASAAVKVALGTSELLLLLTSSAVTHIGIGFAAHAEGRLRMVLALAARSVALLSATGARVPSHHSLDDSGRGSAEPAARLRVTGTPSRPGALSLSLAIARRGFGVLGAVLVRDPGPQSGDDFRVSLNADALSAASASLLRGGTALLTRVSSDFDPVETAEPLARVMPWQTRDGGRLLEVPLEEALAAARGGAVSEAGGGGLQDGRSGVSPFDATDPSQLRRDKTTRGGAAAVGRGTFLLRILIRETGRPGTPSSFSSAPGASGDAGTGGAGASPRASASSASSGGGGPDPSRPGSSSSGGRRRPASRGAPIPYSGPVEGFLLPQGTDGLSPGVSSPAAGAAAGLARGGTALMRLSTIGSTGSSSGGGGRGDDSAGTPNPLSAAPSARHLGGDGGGRGYGGGRNAHAAGSVPIMPPPVTLVGLDLLIDYECRESEKGEGAIFAGETGAEGAPLDEGQRASGAPDAGRGMRRRIGRAHDTSRTLRRGGTGALASISTADGEDDGGYGGASGSDDDCEVASPSDERRGACTGGDYSGPFDAAVAEVSFPPVVALLPLHRGEALPHSSLPQGLPCRVAQPSAVGLIPITLARRLLAGAPLAPETAAVAADGACGGVSGNQPATGDCDDATAAATSAGSEGSGEGSGELPTAEPLQPAAPTDTINPAHILHPITHALLVSGPSESAIREALPLGYSIHGDNLASLACAGALAERAHGGGVGGRGSGAGAGAGAAEECDDDDRSALRDSRAPRGGGAPVGNTAPWHSDVAGGSAGLPAPACVFLAVRRAVPIKTPRRSRTASDEEDPGTTSEGALAVPDTRPVYDHSYGTQTLLRDAGIAVAMGCGPSDDGGGSPSAATGGSGGSLRWPPLSAPRGYAVQAVDIQIAVESTAHDSDGVAGDGAARCMPVRLVLTQTDDLAAAATRCRDGCALTFGPSPSASSGAAPLSYTERTAGTIGGTPSSPQLRAAVSARGGARGDDHDDDDDEGGRDADGPTANLTPAQQRAALIARITAARAAHADLLRASGGLHRQLSHLLALRSGTSGGGGGAGAGGNTDGAGGGGEDNTTPGGGPAIVGPAERSELSGVSAAFAAADKEKRYMESLIAVEAERKRWAEERSAFDSSAMTLQAELDAREARAGAIGGAFEAFRQQTAREAVDSRTGARLPPEVVARYEAADRDKTAELGGMQLRAIHLSNQLAALEAQLASRQQLADGLALVDFEQVSCQWWCDKVAR